MNLLPPTVYAATGHRPNKLGGYDKIVDAKLLFLAVEYLRKLPDVNYVISGMALGWDQAWAVAAWTMGIRVMAAIPFEGQEKTWPSHSQVRYKKILSNCFSVKVVAPGGYDPDKMQKRNEWMVNNCDKLVALWDGSPGGTGNCIAYAQSKVPIDNLWEAWSKT